MATVLGEQPKPRPGVPQVVLRPPQWAPAALYLLMKRLGVTDRDERVKGWWRNGDSLDPTNADLQTAWRRLKASGLLPRRRALREAASYADDYMSEPLRP